MMRRAGAHHDVQDIDFAAAAGLKLTGTSKADVLSGGDGNDTIKGLAGNDVLSGGAGADTLLGGDGKDQIDGGDDDDTIIEVYADGDVLSGGAGNDTISVTQSAYDKDVKPGQLLSIDGGDGDDRVSVHTDQQDLRIDLGAGNDRVDLLIKTYGLTADRAVTLGAGRDTFRIVPTPYIFETNYVVHITDFATGRSGDIFDLGDYAKSESGSQRSDYNPFAWGDVELIKSDENTVVTFRGMALAVLDNTRPRDFTDQNLGFDLDAAPPPGETYVGTDKADSYYGTDLGDTVNLLGGNDNADGKYGDDVIDGGAGNDYLDGWSGKDTLIGGTGDDVLNGGDGLNHLIGGDGDDMIGWTGGADAIDGGAGFDTLVLNNTSVARIDLDARLLPRDGTVVLMGQTGSGLEALENRLYYFRDADDRILLGKLWSTGLDAYGGGGDDQFLSGRNDSHLEGAAGDDILTTLDGDDGLVGDEGDDVLASGGGNDTLDGGDGDDVLTSGGGNDTLLTGAGVDRVNAGAGNDTVSSHALVAHDVLDGGAGTDSLTLAAGVAAVALDLTRADGTVSLAGGTATLKNFETITVALSRYDDTVVLAAAAKTVVFADGLAGDDHLMGGAMDDRLSGGNGDDILEGGGGSNVLIGGAGNDTYYLSGADTVVEAASGGVDQVFASVSTVLAFGVENGTLLGTAMSLTGNGSNNTLVGNTEGNLFVGGGGNDRIDGRAGDDVASYVLASTAVTIELGAGGTVTVDDGQGTTDTLTSVEGVIGSGYGDVLRGSAGANRLSGAAGDDLLDGGSGDDVLDGGTGLDTASYAAFAGSVRVDLSVGRAYYRSETDTLSGIENVVGSGYADTIIKDDSAGTLIGGAGDDFIQGGAANDTIDGGSGSDHIEDRGGTDTITYAGFSGGVRVDLSVGRAFFGSETDTLSGIENVTGTGYDDVIINADTNGVLAGGAGNDFVQGGIGNDTMSGGAGTDTLSYDRALSGVDVHFDLPFGDTGGAGSDTFSGFENLVGSAYDDTLQGTYDEANVIDGRGGNDIIGSGIGDTMIGGDGIDTVDYSNQWSGVTVNLGITGAQQTGGCGINTLSGIEAIAGTNYDDTLTGSAGDDTLGGGTGDDTLTGGGGADKFVFASIGDIDTITDFAHGVDKIFFPGSIAGMPTGPLADSAFRAGTAAQDADDRVIYDANSGRLYFDPDGNGSDYDAFQVAVISNHTVMSASDFVVI